MAQSDEIRELEKQLREITMQRDLAMKAHRESADAAVRAEVRIRELEQEVRNLKQDEKDHTEILADQLNNKILQLRDEQEENRNLRAQLEQQRAARAAILEKLDRILEVGDAEGWRPEQYHKAVADLWKALNENKVMEYVRIKVTATLNESWKAMAGEAMWNLGCHPGDPILLVKVPAEEEGKRND